MPPPPPSASYLWKFDDLSDDENEDIIRSSRLVEETPPPRIESPKCDAAPAASSTKAAAAAAAHATPDMMRQLRTAMSTTDSSTNSPVSKKKKNQITDDGQYGTTASPRPTLPCVVSDTEEKEDIPNFHVEPIRRVTTTPKTAVATATTTKTTTAAGFIPRKESIVAIETDTTTDDEEELDTSAETTNETIDTLLPRQQARVSSSSRKRKIGKKKKKKKKATTTASVVGESGRSQQQQRVTFEFVHIYSFDRCLGVSVVPGDGGWPLGMATVHNTSDSNCVSLEAAERCSSSSVPIDDYERAKQERLKQRFATLPSSSVVGLIKADASSLESRQWDFKRQCRNPLFGPLNETERATLLLASSELNAEVKSIITTSSDSKALSTRKPTRRVTRSPSQNSTASSSSHSLGSSMGHHDGEQQYNEIFTAMDVRHVRNELEQIRISRSMEGATGCSCRKLNVYLLPSTTNKGTGTSAGKKAHHRRMKLAKVKEELRKRKLLPPDEENTSRETLELLLHEAVEKEPCCTPMSGCSCVRNGIECQADTCSCWHASHQITASASSSSPPSSIRTTSDSSCSVTEIQSRCGNPVAGMFVVDFAKIEAFRANFLATMTTCPTAKA